MENLLIVCILKGSSYCRCSPSTAVQGDIYGVGPTYDTSDTEHTNPIYQLYVKNSTGWVNNGKFTSIAAGVVQTTGTSTTEVMSQDAVTRDLQI